MRKTMKRTLGLLAIVLSPVFLTSSVLVTDEDLLQMGVNEYKGK